jgi:D-glycero-D-manno-heptose 1,7-bisphosphate phosphatase
MPSSRRARHRAVFLDRDGVLNRSDVRNGKPYAPRNLSNFRLQPGAARAVDELKAAGFIVVVVTNQPDIGNGLMQHDTLDAMHEKLRAKVAVDDIMVCPHRQDEGCSCRKPKPGMIRQAMRRWGIDATQSYMVGDRGNDIVAGYAAGLYTVFVERGYTEALTIRPDLIVRSLSQAASRILQRRRQGAKR